jgi:hypothetical protein
MTKAELDEQGRLLAERTLRGSTPGPFLKPFTLRTRRAICRRAIQQLEGCQSELDQGQK